MFLKVNNLSMNYGSTVALNEVSFSAPKGSLTCLLGPSGCGKTTVLRALGGFITPTRGEMLLNSQNLGALAPENRPISTVFQSYGLFPHKTVLENVIYGLKFKKVPPAQQKIQGLDMLQVMGLQGYENRMIQELSGGEQQRVALARSLIVRPDLLLLDEPLSNLDAGLRVSMRQEIQQVQKDFGITTLFVTHDQEDAFAVADQIVLLNKGEVEQISSPQELYNRPNKSFTLTFIGRNNAKRVGEKTFYLRPEDITIHPQGATTGRVLNRTFHGATTTLLVDVDREPHPLEVLLLSPQAHYNVGDEIQLDYEFKELRS